MSTRPQRCPAGGSLAFLSLILFPSLLTAADRTWDGGDPANVSWADPDNWNSNVAPTLGDRLIFPSGVTDVATNNNFLAGVPFLGLEFTGDNYSVAGNAFVLGASGIVVNVAGTGRVDIDAAITLNSDQIWSMAASDGLTLEGTVNVGSRQLTLTGEGNAVFDGGINGTTGAIIVDGPGFVTFNGAKSFAGPLTINNDGNLTINHSSGLGTLAGGTTIGGTLHLGGGGLIIAENLTLSGGTIRSTSGGHSLTGGVVLQPGGLSQFSVTGGTMTITGVISGAGGFRKSGTGDMLIAGSSANTYSGDTIFYSGLNMLQKPAGVTAIPSANLPEVPPIPSVNLIVGNGSFPAVEVRLNNPEQIDDSTGVAVGSNGTFNLNGRTETVKSLTLEGPGEVQIGAGGTLRLGSAAMSLLTWNTDDLDFDDTAVVGAGKLELLAAETTWKVDHVVAGMDLRVNANVSTALERSVLIKEGSGKMELTGTNTVPVLKIKKGHVVITGDSSAMNCELDGSGVLLAGDGEIGDLTSLAGGGAVNPGVTQGILQCGDVKFNAATTLQVQLSNNAVPGTNYDQLDVTGTVDLGGAALDLSLLLFSATTGDEFWIVRNDGQDLLTGTFAGLPEGAYFNAGGQDFHITYKGGEGNDVIVTRVVPPTGNTKRWSGLSAANSNWTTAANWVGVVAPVAGDRLLFPEGASRLSNTNNFAAGTTFHSITIQASGYTLSGNQVVLNEGLTATHGTTAASTVSLPLRTALDQTFSSNGGLNLNGAIDLDGKMVDFTKTTATGNMIVNGVISGQGRLTKRGNGDLFLNAANTYSASTFIEEGLIDIQTSTSLGTSLAQVRPGASLLINSNGSINPVNTLALEGTLVSSGAAASHSWQGTVILVGPTPVIQVGTPLTLSGMILDSANGGFTKTGTGTLRLSGSSANNFDGGLTINQGMVELAKTAGVVALPGPVTVGDGTGTDTLRLINADQIADTATVHLNRGVLDMTGVVDTIASLDSTGGTMLSSSPAQPLRINTALTIQAGAAPTTLNGWVRCGNNMTWNIADGAAADDLILNAFSDAVSNSVVMRKEGAGRVVFNTGTVIPFISVAAGTARVMQGAATQFNLDGGRLDGTGVISRIISSSGGGIVAPGLSPGRLTVTQQTVWNSQTTFAVELLSSATAGTTYDQLTAAGTVNLGGATLQVTPLAGFTGNIGDTFTIIDNDGIDAVTGTFAGLPAGAVVTSGVFAFSISYTGGTGNDVVLTRVVPPIAPNLTSMTLSPGTGPGGQDVVIIGGTVAPLAVVTLQASTDFVSWTDVQSIAADASGVLSFTVNQTPGIPRRVFRIEP